MIKKTKKYPPKKIDNSHITIAAVKRNWSDFQKKIFLDIAKGQKHTVIIARAGCSKTSSIVEGVKYIPKGKQAIFVAFNKSIQEELKSKLPSYCPARTLHSLGLQGLKSRFGNIEINNYKCWEIVEAFFSNPKEEYDLIDNICKTISGCKATLCETYDKIEDLILQHNIDTCEIEIKQFISYVLKGLQLCKEKTDVVDFDDMIYLPLVHKVNIGKYDYIFCDESHDFSKAMFELSLSALKTTGRAFFMIDNFQCIYSFRFADENMLENIRSRLNPTELYLPVCYRCPSKVVELAKNIVPDFTICPNAIEGEIINIKYDELIKTIKPGSYLLSRFNAPLIKWCLILLKNGIPANILGRDIGDNLLYLVKKSKKKTVKDFLKWIDNWAKDEKEKMVAKRPKCNTEVIDDKVECLYNLSDGASSLEDIKKNIDKLFKDNDEKKIVLASSFHRIKGKQQENVFVLENTLLYPLYSEPNLDLNLFNSEANCTYIAISRTMKRLYLVNK